MGVEDGLEFPDDVRSDARRLFVAADRRIAGVTDG